MADIKITGIEEVCANLDKIARTFENRVVSKALDAAVVPVMNGLETNTPVGDDPTSGELKAAVMYDKEPIESGGVVAHVGFGEEQGMVAHWVEYGHRLLHMSEIEKDKLLKITKGRVPAHPFIRPTAEETAQEAFDAFAESIKQQVDSGLLG